MLECQAEDGTISFFRVSSKVLQLVSPIFVRMFGSSFKEGQELLRRNHVTFMLEGDDPLLIALILKVLHYQTDSEDRNMKLEDLANLTVHCDKYDCTKAVGPWVSTWFKNIEGVEHTTTEMWFRLLAAYKFNDPRRFSEISKVALTGMTPDFRERWSKEDALALLPVNVLGTLGIYVFQLSVATVIL